MIDVQASELPREYLDRNIEREGISIRVRAESIDDNASLKPQAGQMIRLSIEGKRLADNQPLKNWQVGAWLDRETNAMSGAIPTCGQRVTRYLSGNLIDRPILDLTGYYVLSLDNESTISVLDPSVNFSGRSSLYSSLKLEGLGFDWVKTTDDAKLFVALPNEKKLAIIDLQTLKVIKHINLEGQPTRLRLQPDERFVWAGMSSVNPEENLVAIVDTIEDKLLTQIRLPAGYHEIVFSDNEEKAYVSNRQSYSITLIDITSLEVINEIKLNFEPLGLVYDDRHSLLWVVNGKDGRIHRYDKNGNPIDHIVLKPGLGPVTLSPDGSYIFVLNTSQHWLHVIETSSGKEKHRLTISGQPYDVIFSEKYAYIRSLESEQIGLLSLNSLKTDQPILKFVPAGADPLLKTNNLVRASTMALTMDRAGAFFVTPSERTIHHFMEGMNAPNTATHTYGHVPMSAMTVKRGFHEIQPGLYTTVIRLPSSGSMVLALASENPVIRECLGLNIDSSPSVETEYFATVHWLSENVQKTTNDEKLNFRIRLESKNKEVNAIKNLRLRIIPAYGGMGMIWPLQKDMEKKKEWFASNKILSNGSYYVHVEADEPLESTYSTVIVETPKKLVQP